MQTTNFLLSIPKIRVDVDSLIENGLALEPICKSDGEIQHKLQAASAGSTFPTNITQKAPPPNAAIAQTYEAQAAEIVQPIFTRLKELLKFNNDRFEKTRGNLMVVATLIATMSFQVAVNPPGGFWQEDTSSDQGCPDGKSVCKAGTAIQAYKYNNNKNKTENSYKQIFSNKYHNFIACSTISFCASLSIILLLISGIPLGNRISVGILILGMFISVLFTAATYMISIGFVQAPDDQQFFEEIVLYYFRFWVLLLLVIVGIHVLRFCWWILKKLFGFLFWLVKNLLKVFTPANQLPRTLV